MSEKNTSGSRAAKKERLSDREKLYCRLYVHCFNQTRAYMEAFGVDRRNAYGHAFYTHNKKAVQAEIQRLLDKKYQEIDLRPESVIQKHIDIAFANINDYVELAEDGSLRLKDLSSSDGTAVSEIQYSPSTGAFRIRLNDRQKSLEWLAQNMGAARGDDNTGVVILPEINE